MPFVPAALALGVLATLSPAAAAEADAPFGLTGLEFAFAEALALIALACLSVPASRRLGLGSVIGYLVAGVAAGAVLRLSYAEHPEELLHFAEFGVVLFLFVIGLEFRPRRLWEMRATIFGRGLVQVLACGAVLGGAAYAFGLDWRAATIVGLGFALSSTALVMREIDEGGERRTPFGETAIAVLLFEDLAIVPLLLLVALIAPAGGDMTLAGNAEAVAIGLAAIAFLILVGRHALDPMFRAIARTRTPELMTAAALGVVVFASLVMALAGLSYAMGALTAGQFLGLFALQRAGGPVLLSLLGAVGALVGVPIAIGILGEAPPPGLAPAAVLIAAGIALVTWGGLRAAKWARSR